MSQRKTLSSSLASSSIADPAVASFIAKTEKNPFILPSDEEVFTLREKMREERERTRFSQATKKVWERDDMHSTLSMTRKTIAQIGTCISYIIQIL
jgi:hypothetical protein